MFTIERKLKAESKLKIKLVSFFIKIYNIQILKFKTIKSQKLLKRLNSTGSNYGKKMWLPDLVKNEKYKSIILAKTSNKNTIHNHIIFF